MRGTDITQESLFTVSKLDDYVPEDHPLRAMREMVNAALKELNSLFATIYSDVGRASIAPEKLMRALLLQILYSVRSERMLMEQLQYNLLFRWFVGIAIDGAVWDHSVFSKNRDRLLEHDVVGAFFGRVLALADKHKLLSQDHFSVDGTLVQAWASQKSYQRKDGTPPSQGGGPRNAASDFRGQKRKNDTHESTSDPQARLYRKSVNTGAILCYQGHILMEHRNGLICDARVSLTSGKSERETALAMLDALPGAQRKTVAADKGYDTADFVADCRGRNITPHVTQNTTNRRSAIDARTTRHSGYGVSQKLRAWIETHFGWGKTVGQLRQVKIRSRAQVEQLFRLTMAASNLVRLRRLIPDLGVAR